MEEFITKEEESWGKYPSIPRWGKRGTREFATDPEHTIVIMEKLDGANASFLKEDGEIKFFSRNREIKEEEGETLRGFTVWMRENVDFDEVPEGYIHYGEWLVKHAVDYGENANGFYLFDIYSIEEDEFLPFHKVVGVANLLQVQTPPTFYRGKGMTEEELFTYVGDSELAVGGKGEGVIVKSDQRDSISSRHQRPITKLVAEGFAEKTQSKKAKKKKPEDSLDEFLHTYLTQARTDKMIEKLKDEGVIPEDAGVEHTGVILQNSGQRILDDIISEEYDNLEKIMKKKIGKIYPKYVKENLNPTKEEDNE